MVPVKVKYSLCVSGFRPLLARFHERYVHRVERTSIQSLCLKICSLSLKEFMEIMKDLYPKEM